jgi:hypothetical protein
MEQRQIIRPGDSLPEVLGFTDFFGYLLHKSKTKIAIRCIGV